MSVIVIGSINRDVVCRVPSLPRPGETIVARDTCELPGGKGANQAVAAARMGAAVSMIGCIGADAAGAWQRDALTAVGIDTSGIAITSHLLTGSAYIAIDAHGENQIIVDPGANQATSASMIADVSIARARVVLTQLETPIATARHAFMLAGRSGARRILNTAPALIEAAELFTLADVIVLNQTELAQYLGRNGDVIGLHDASAARQLLTRVEQCVVVTLGAAGAVLIDGRSEHVVPGLAVKAIDTTGAGDCFCGALAAFIAEAMPWPRALRLANAAAALCVQSAGATPAMPFRGDVERLAALGADLI